ncbi:MAG: phosphate-starvation-inducible PsiE family protein [Cyanobacteriota bacterium]|nr:phosphate-starvation-inducible PsiE family protein [Cyanobacteriota bacterium]
MASEERNWLSERRFLQVVDHFEQLIAKVLSVLLVVLICLASFELLKQLTLSLIGGQPLERQEALNDYFGELLNILIALELLQNLTAYLQRHAVQIQLVLLTAITAVARKLIVLPGEDATKPQLVVALGVCVICLAGAYWLIRTINQPDPPTRTPPARSFQERDRSPAADGGDSG